MSSKDKQTESMKPFNGNDYEEMPTNEQACRLKRNCIDCGIDMTHNAKRKTTYRYTLEELKSYNPNADYTRQQI